MSSEAAEALKARQAGLRTGVSRLRAALSASKESAEELAGAANALLPLLFQHVTAPKVDARCEGDHLSLRSLARDFQFVLENPSLYPYPHRARLAASLADALSAHLDRELEFLLR